MEFGVEMPESPYFIVFDYESLLKKSDTQANVNTQWLEEHIPVSVVYSVYSVRIRGD